MLLPITEAHKTDAAGNPTGGTTTSVGMNIVWQDGPLGRGADRREPNGAFVESVILAAKLRLAFYQSAADGKFACAENAEAISHLDAALKVLDERTKARAARDVEGTHRV